MVTESEQRHVVVDGSEVAPLYEPESVCELRELISGLDQSDTHALVTGSGTWLSFGNLGGPFETAISTARLDSVLDYSSDDLTIAVQAGASINSINEVLAESGQMLAGSAPCPDTATIGGSFATGLDGPSRMGFGSLKDSVIGIEAILASGKLIKSGGMVVKNVTGYDMSGLFHGSLGAFGIVTRLNLKVALRPEVFREFVFTFEQYCDAIAAGMICLSSGLEIAGIFAEGSFGGNHRLHFYLSGIEDAVRRQGSTISELIYERSTPVDAQMSDLEDRRLKSFENFVDMSKHRAIARISCPASRQFQLLNSFSDIEEIHSWAYLADLGSGLVYLHSNFEANLSLFDGEIDSISWLALEPAQKKDMDVFGPMPERNISIVRRLKQEFDPAGRFNRGRFIAGL